MIYHGTTPITSAYIGVTPLVGVAKGTEEMLNESNFILADGSTFLTSNGDTFLAKEE